MALAAPWLHEPVHLCMLWHHLFSLHEALACYIIWYMCVGCDIILLLSQEAVCWQHASDAFGTVVWIVA